MGHILLLSFLIGCVTIGTSLFQDNLPDFQTSEEKGDFSQDLIEERSYTPTIQAESNNTLNITAPQLTPSIVSRGVVHWYRTMALLFLEDRVPYWAEKINVSPKNIRAKNQHTLWGSCSKRSNLNFNWRILLLSNQAADYLIIHELSHLKEMNHSPKFWKLVHQYSPEYKMYKVELKHKNAWLKYPDNSL